MRVGLRHVLVKFQIARGEWRAIGSSVGQQSEQLVENLCAQFAAALQSSLLLERVKKPRSLINLPAGDQQPRNSRKFVGCPFHAPRRASLFEAHENVRRRLPVLGVIAMTVMEEPDRRVEVRRVAPERFLQPAAVGAEPVSIAQEAVVESLRLFVGPERVERTDVERFGFAASFELKENFNLFFEEVIFLIRERRLVLAQSPERLVVILLLDQVINELLDDLK